MIAILTDFVNFDPAYSLCRVVRDQCKMLQRDGRRFRMIVRKGYHGPPDAYPGAEIITADPGQTGDNQVHLTPEVPRELDQLTADLERALEGVTVVLAHDLIYQPNCWKWHITARRIARKRPEIKWIQWVHSSTDLGISKQVGPYVGELQGAFPNSLLVAFHREEVNRKGALFGYEQDRVVIVPNPVDFLEDAHPLTRRIADEFGLMRADVIAVYPCRLDRGKQPHVIAEIFEQLRAMGYDARVVVCDFHSLGGDKVKYRDEMARQYAEFVHFTSQLDGETDGIKHAYLLPHRVVMELLELGDVLVHPSVSEADSLVLAEAMWKRCGLVLNFDLPRFREFDGLAVFGKFSSYIDVNTGMPGGTQTSYGNRTEYMRSIAGAIDYQMRNNPTLALHAKMRKERSLTGAWLPLQAAIEGQW